VQIGEDGLDAMKAIISVTDVGGRLGAQEFRGPREMNYEDVGHGRGLGLEKRVHLPPVQLAQIRRALFGRFFTCGRSASGSLGVGQGCR
jgi:hypothetical protein